MGRNGVNGPRCRRPVDGLYTTEAEAKAEVKVIVTRPRPAIFVYNSGSTDLLGQRDLLRSFETANNLIGMGVPEREPGQGSRDTGQFWPIQVGSRANVSGP